jgi:ankyrin repeat protein
LTYSREKIRQIVTSGNIEEFLQLKNDPEIDLNRPCFREDIRPIHIACENGYTNIVRELLLNPNIELNLDPLSYNTPLWLASHNGHVEIVRLLLEDKRSAETIDKKMYNGSTALYAACQANHIEVVKVLLDYPGAKEDLWETLFQVAGLNGTIQCIQYILIKRIEQQPMLLDASKTEILEKILPGIISWCTKSVDPTMNGKDIIYLCPDKQIINLSSLILESKKLASENLSAMAFLINRLFCREVFQLSDVLTIPHDEMNNTRRVFLMTKKIPIEAQMILWCKYGRKREVTISKESFQEAHLRLTHGF